MENNSPSRGFDARVWKNICFKANGLAARCAVLGMTIEDYQQELAVDLIHRSRWFDPRRATFRTFADRVTTHRVATLTQPTAKTRHERMTVSLDASGSDAGPGVAVGQLIDAGPPVDDAALARVDLGRFLNGVAPALRQCCVMLQGDGIANEAKAAGMHRSTVYAHLRRLRAAAVSAGLGVYIPGMPDRSQAAPVGDWKNAGNAGQVPEPTMTLDLHLPLVRTLRELELWACTPATGDVIIYHRGLLALDRGAGSRLGDDAGEELDHVATVVMAMAEGGELHLIQRRHGPGDYSYIAVRASRGGRNRTGRSERRRW